MRQVARPPAHIIIALAQTTTPAGRGGATRPARAAGVGGGLESSLGLGCRPATRRLNQRAAAKAPSAMTPVTSPLSTDLYELNMVQAYLDRAEDKEAVFEFFVRRLPARRGFLLAAGLDDALGYLETLQFSKAEIDWLKSTGRFRANLLDYLASFRFTGDVHAIPEGTVCFPNEPLIRITAPLPQAQLVESRLINILHYQTLIASKAARMVLAAPGKVAVRFRLAHRAWRRGRAFFGARELLSRALPAPPMCWPASATASPSSAPWRIPTSRCMTMRWPPSRTSRARGPTA